MDTSRLPRSTRYKVILFLVLIIWGVTDVRHRARIVPDQPHKHRTDLTVYTEAGAAFFDGRDPYEVTNIRGWRYLYPPLFGILMAPLHGLPTEAQAMVWFFVCLAMVWGSYVECRRIVNLFQDDQEPYPAWMGWAALIAVAFPVLDCLQRGQIGVVLTWLLLLGFRLTWESRSSLLAVAGGIVLALPVVFKVVPALPVGILLLLGVLAWFHRNQKLKVGTQRLGMTLGGFALGMFLFLWGVPGVLTGWQANQNHLIRWCERVGSKAGQVDSEATLDNPWALRNQSLSNAAFRLGNFVGHQFFGGPPDFHAHFKSGTRLPMESPAAQNTILIIRLGLLLVLLLLAWQVARGGDGLGLAAVFGLACVAALVVSPVSWGHYFMLQIPALLLVPMWFRRHGQNRLSLILAVVPPVLCVLHYALLDYAGRVGLLGIGTTLWFLLACAGMMLQMQKEKSETDANQQNSLH